MKALGLFHAGLPIHFTEDLIRTSIIVFRTTPLPIITLMVGLILHLVLGIQYTVDILILPTLTLTLVLLLRAPTILTTLLVIT
jgi:hypothetical protein